MADSRGVDPYDEILQSEPLDFQSRVVQVRPAWARSWRWKSSRKLTTAVRSEAQLRKGDRAWGGSVERNCEPMDKNRIEGATDQGKQA